MLSRFFIDRPIFATVLAILTVLAGAVAIPVLPVEQYPEIAPPTVQVTASYPGANARTVRETVTTPIEQEVNGVEDMLYMSSTSSSDGTMSLTVTFALGTDLDLAAVRLQNRVALASPRLPEEVRRQGIVVEKRSTSLLMVVAMLSPDSSFDRLYLSNFATLRIKDALARIPGVGAVQAFGGTEFSMRIWLDPDELAARRLTTADVLAALREQNVQVAAGSLGEEPTGDGRGFQATLNVQGRLRTADEFEDIVLKVGAEQRTVRLSDVARVELGAQSYAGFARRDLQESATLGIYQRPGSNAVEVAAAVREELERLAPGFPEGVVYQVSYDFTRFVSASIREVSITLALAALLVSITVYVFLQDWRATMIPAATIPVSIVGTFAALLALGFSINLLTLLGLVLAIGVVVDDAIVVVENASRNVDELGQSPREAARQAMDEIAGPIVATTLVVLAVFLPTLVLPGITGQLYRQFGLTVSIATVISSGCGGPSTATWSVAGTPTWPCWDACSATHRSRW
jgi:hydrophobe/amphiphile efflux-1 (HAE1) family protein